MTVVTHTATRRTVRTGIRIVLERAHRTAERRRPERAGMHPRSGRFGFSPPRDDTPYPGSSAGRFEPIAIVRAVLYPHAILTHLRRSMRYNIQNMLRRYRQTAYCSTYSAVITRASAVRIVLHQAT